MGKVEGRVQTGEGSPVCRALGEEAEHLRDVSGGGLWGRELGLGSYGYSVDHVHLPTLVGPDGL